MGRTDASELVPLIPLNIDGEEKALLCWDPAHPKVDKLCFGFAVILFNKGNLTELVCLKQITLLSLSDVRWKVSYSHY